MAKRKTVRDFVAERLAVRMNATLVGTGIDIQGGGEQGPFSITVRRLSRRQLRPVLAAILEATGRRPSEQPPGTNPE